MVSFSHPDDLTGAAFIDVSLRGARFTRSDLSGAVMRAVDIAGADIDAPWLLGGENALLVNGVDVAPFVEAELNRRFPGRGERRAKDPDGLRAAWAKAETAWAAALERVAGMPPGTQDVSVDGEWSFAQTVRHLIMATDTWLGGPILGREKTYHPLGLPNAEYETDGYDLSVFAPGTPPYAEVLEARAGRVAMVREFLAGVTAADLAVTRSNPWAPEHPESTLSCLHTILEEEWEHLRYATRDLDVIAARP
ncbi:DinB family protein [Lentzea sp. BCCO 10_0061]|uniref:DinB family protein n=1 Tax=Lentzea sokolovensis TaxID=3095429 RepID=A0ABU4UQT2_9PSEU|nr:DinB family protein [Lentzea sp. BCCO 10_0061]MDX8141863.1 DinB family protein [Lentzea sp. BCCO 10_0061]